MVSKLHVSVNGNFFMVVVPETHMVDLDVGVGFITFGFHRYLPNIAECICHIIWGIRGTGK